MANRINYKLNRALAKSLGHTVKAMKKSENEFLRCMFARDCVTPDPVAAAMYKARHSFVVFTHGA